CRAGVPIRCLRECRHCDKEQQCRDDTESDSFQHILLLRFVTSLLSCDRAVSCFDAPCDQTRPCDPRDRRVPCCRPSRPRGASETQSPFSLYPLRTSWCRCCCWRWSRLCRLRGALHFLNSHAHREPRQRIRRLSDIRIHNRLLIRFAESIV